MKVRVILLKDVENLGKKYTIHEVTPGYFRNFLLPKGLAKKATPEALKWLEMQKEILQRKAEEELKNAQELASRLDGLEVIFNLKTGDKKQLFTSITATKIAEKLKEMGFSVKRNQILLPRPIKELGEFPVKVRLEHNLEPEIKIIVTEEK